jgi:hypothetical protein
VRFRKIELKIIAAFALAGLVLPFGTFLTFWLATRDPPILDFESHLRISSLLYPGARGVFPGLVGRPPNRQFVVSVWTRALAQNLSLYAVTGFIIIFNLASREVC